MPGRIDRLKPLPEGKGILKGRFLYGEKPASGIKFRMALNGNYRTKFIRSDDSGEFSISLPPGTWHLNNLQCKEWNNRPEGQFVLVSGDEADLETSSYNDLFFLFSDKGKAIEVSDESNPAISLNILIRSKMKILWPTPNEPKQKGTVSASEIKWEPFPKAASYVIKISRVTREGSRRTTFTPILYKRINGTTSIPISQLSNAQDATSKEEYAVRIRAYDIKGKFLTESEHSFSTFVLSDNHVLVENIDDNITTVDKDAIARKYQLQKTMAAVELLIQENMFPEANSLLKKMDETEYNLQKELLTGYLFAAQGKCQEANEHFDNALANGQKCIPKKFKVECN